MTAQPSTLNTGPPLFSAGPYKALVIGAGGAIGSAFTQALRADPACVHVETISRGDGRGFDLSDQASISAQAEIARERGPYEIIVDATGALMIHGMGPEKSLQSLQADHLMQSFYINAIGPALVLRYFTPLLAKGSSVYGKLSARVGSISDNQKGGWYGYRSAKAALNMMLQSAAIELQRKNPGVRVVALQPGTVRSPLSEPFTGSATSILEPAESVHGMLSALKKLQAKQGAHFIDYKGLEIPW